MESLVGEILGGASGVGAYLLVLAVLLACGLGVPLPEDVALITGGYLAFSGAARLEVMVAVAFVGILGGDSFVYLLGRRFGSKLERRWPFRLMITPSKRRKVEGLFERYGQRIVVAARFMPGVRAVTYFVAGSAGMRYLHFIVFDGLAALVSAPLFVFLGYHFGANIEWLVGAVRRGQWAVIGLLVAIAGVWLFFHYVVKRVQERPAEPPVLDRHERARKRAEVIPEDARAAE
ncbi:MAG: DedA family protein [Myxococcales bacterium]